MSPGWYLRRMAAMSPAEVVHRGRETAVKAWWKRRHRAAPPATVTACVAAWTGAHLDPSDGAVAALIAHADEIMAGRCTMLGAERTDLVDPDWYLDPTSGIRSPDHPPAFDIAVRDWDVVGDVKQIWELGRHHHLTVLAAAYRATGDEAYAMRVAEHLRSWAAQCPFPQGIHWTSGIEVGIRLVSWAWCRRLLDGWSGLGGLLREPAVQQQVFDHCRHLHRLHSVGSSFNNHAIAEAVGLYVGSLELPWFPESGTWQRIAAGRVLESIAANTTAGGADREQATDYHGFVLELVTVAAVAASLHRRPEAAMLWERVAAMTAVAACLTDPTGRPAREGDSDRGRVLVLDDDRHELHRWRVLLDLPVGACVRTRVFEAFLGTLPVPKADVSCDRALVEAGQEIRVGGTAVADGVPRVWSRFDVGRHGHLSIAAHGHADALSIELRHGGVDVLADPGTGSYRPDSTWREYFRSTRSHNTVEIDGRDQSRSGGAFLWTRHAATTVVERSATRVVASHDGYADLDDPCVHRRAVTWCDDGVQLVDEIETAGRHRVAMHLHLGPDVSCLLDGGVAALSWPGGRGRIELDPQLRWSCHRGEESPRLGWYSPTYGVVVPSPTLVGVAELGACVLRTRVRVAESSDG